MIKKILFLCIFVLGYFSVVAYAAEPKSLGKYKNWEAFTYDDGSAYIGKFNAGKEEGVGECINKEGESKICKSKSDVESKEFVEEDVLKIKIVAKPTMCSIAVPFGPKLHQMRLKLPIWNFWAALGPQCAEMIQNATETNPFEHLFGRVG